MQTTVQSPSTVSRPLPAKAERVLVIGLDGATFDILHPLMADGMMPRLKGAIDAGAAGILHSTVPPITPAAWTTFLTGVQPGTHGIIDFERYDVHTNKLEFNSTRSLSHVRNIWQILGDLGFRVGSVNVPMTFPPINVNGFLVSGFETPGPGSDFVFPRDIKQEILDRWPDPTLRTKWRRKTFGGNALFAQNIEYMCRSFHQGAEMTTWLGDKFGWDVLMVVLKLVDNLQHKTWKYLDPRWSDRNPVRRDLARRGFAEADKAVGTLLDYASANSATVMIVSDHGHGSLEGKVQPNLLLKQWGYLTLHGGGAQKATRGRHLWDRFLGRTGKFARAGDVGHDLAVDFSRTRACVMHAGMAGFLYLNLAGRQPEGIVPESDYEAVRDELREKLLGESCSVVDPTGETVQMFTEVHKPEELYGCSRQDQPWMPDLLLIPQPGLAVIRKIRGRSPVRWLPYRRIEGTHRPEGIFVAAGPGIAKGVKVTAQIGDCAPTIMAAMGLRVPSDMEGRVLTEIFDEPIKVETEVAGTIASGASMAAAKVGVPTNTASDENDTAAAAYSEEELRKVTDRLADLGYLE